MAHTTTPSLGSSFISMSLYLITLGLVLIVIFWVIDRGLDISERLHKQNLCESAKLTQNTDYLDQCKSWGM